MKQPVHAHQLFHWAGREAHQLAADYETLFQRRADEANLVAVYCPVVEDEPE